MNKISAQWTDTETEETIMVMFSMRKTESVNSITEMAHALLKEEGADLLLSETEWEYI